MRVLRHCSDCTDAPPIAIRTLNRQRSRNSRQAIARLPCRRVFLRVFLMTGCMHQDAGESLGPPIMAREVNSWRSLAKPPTFATAAEISIKREVR